MIRNIPNGLGNCLGSYITSVSMTGVFFSCFVSWAAWKLGNSDKLSGGFHCKEQHCITMRMFAAAYIMWSS